MVPRRRRRLNSPRYLVSSVPNLSTRLPPTLNLCRSTEIKVEIALALARDPALALARDPALALILLPLKNVDPTRPLRLLATVNRPLPPRKLDRKLRPLTPPSIVAPSIFSLLVTRPTAPTVHVFP